MTHTPYTTLFSLTRLDYISQRQIKEVRMPHNGRILGSPPQFNPIPTRLLHVHVVSSKYGICRQSSIIVLYMYMYMQSLFHV